MILMTKATLSKNCSSNQGHLFILPHYASWHSYKTRGCKGYHAILELRSTPLCAHVCRKQARRKARKVKHVQLRSLHCCRSSEPLHPVRTIGSGKMETHIVCRVDANATTIPTREDMLLLSEHPNERRISHVNRRHGEQATTDRCSPHARAGQLVTSLTLSI